MYSKLPIVYENNEQFWRKYNLIHMNEHQEMANWLSALADAYSLGLKVSYYNLPVLLPDKEDTIKHFFSVNQKQHMIYYDFLNQIGSKLEIPVYVFPRNYPSPIYDMNLEYMLKTERDIHDTLFRTIKLIIGE
ncbi:MAG: hypothetical protein QXV73_04095 [Candidatus Micrarchaeia archaeon]